MDDVKEVRLHRSDSIGLGFSVFGGKGSGFPPVIYQVVEQSPAAVSGVLEAGDVILEVNDKNVVSLTTKEVLKCLRLSNDVVTLKVKKDATIKERVHHHMAASSELESLHRSKENGRILRPPDPPHENGENIPPSKPKFESFVMTGELIIKTKSSTFLPKNNCNKSEDDLKNRGGKLSKSPTVDEKSSLGYSGNFVRTSRSEDFLQKTQVSTVNIELEEATSLHNLMDTSPKEGSSDHVTWSCKSPVTATGMDSRTSTDHNLQTGFQDTQNDQFPDSQDLDTRRTGQLPDSQGCNTQTVSHDQITDFQTDTRTGQFIHIPTFGQSSSEMLVNDHNRPRYSPRTGQGVTNIVIDENKIYVKVLPDHTQQQNGQIPRESDSHGQIPRESDSPKRCCSPEEDVESLSSFHYSPKAVDMPSASRLAKRLFNLEGFKKSDVSRHLCKNNDFSRVVGEEYVSFFEFKGESLDSALREFLRRFCLIGETQERERVLVHFSKRFLDCNQGAFKSQDAVHTLTCALMLLNTDLHGENVGRRMTCTEFVENLSELNEGENFSKEVLKALYHSIKTNPLEWAVDDEEESPAAEEHAPNQPDQRQSFVGHNPFLEVPNPNCATEYKKGYVMRKCCVDPNGKKTPMGKRGWKMFYADLRDLVLYLHKDENGVKRNQLYDSLHNAIRVHHSLATRAADYTKKQYVFRLQTADQAVYLFQTSDSKELQSWLDTLNYVAASLSAPSLEGACGAQKKFQRPLLPAAPTKLNFREQLLDLESKVMKLEKEIEEHLSHPPERSAKSRVVNEYVEKEQILQYELRRYRTYILLLRSKVSQFPELEPPLVHTSIGEVDEEAAPFSPPPFLTAPQSSVDASKRSLTDRFSYRAAIYKTEGGT